jgi:hypothetical protein
MALKEVERIIARQEAVRKLKEENKKLRECLEDYANEEFWQEVMLKHPVKDQWLPIGENGFHRAQECLEELEG